MLQSYAFCSVKQNKSRVFYLKAAPLRGRAAIRLISSTLQKATFYAPKGGLLQPEKLPFARRKTAFAAVPSSVGGTAVGRIAAQLLVFLAVGLRRKLHFLAERLREMELVVITQTEGYLLDFQRRELQV